MFSIVAACLLLYCTILEHPVVESIIRGQGQTKCQARLGSCRHKLVRGPNTGRFFSSCVCLVYFLHKSTKFHFNRTECQRILFHFLLLIFSYLLQSLLKMDNEELIVDAANETPPPKGAPTTTITMVYAIEEG